MNANYKLNWQNFIKQNLILKFRNQNISSKAIFLTESLMIIDWNISYVFFVYCRAVLYDFSKLLEELVHSADRCLSPGLETNAKLMYKKMIRTSTDPYKRYDF